MKKTVRRAELIFVYLTNSGDAAGVCVSEAGTRLRLAVSAWHALILILQHLSVSSNPLHRGSPPDYF